MANLIKTLSIAKRINEQKTNLIVSNSIVNVDNNQIEILINGIPSVVKIDYEGSSSFFSLMPNFIKTRISNNSIIISNVFRIPFPKQILNYSGNIRILSCKVLNFDGTSVSSTINNLQDQEKINRQDTNIEGEDLILFSETKQKKSTRRGFSTPVAFGNIATAINNLEVGKLTQSQISDKSQKFIQNMKKNNIVTKAEIVKEQAKPEIKQTNIKIERTPNVVSEDKKGKY